MLSAHNAALQLVALFLRREAFVLSIQDAFRLTIFVIGVAVIATLFVRGTPRQARIPVQTPPPQSQAPVESEAEHFVPVEV